MAIHKHTVSVLDPSTGGDSRAVIMAQRIGVANVIGGGAGLSVVTPVAFPEGLPANYQVFVTASQDAVGFVTAKTAAGFSVTLFPRLAANTLAAGTFDVLIIAA
jgi:hypothetical protein